MPSAKSYFEKRLEKLLQNKTNNISTISHPNSHRSRPPSVPRPFSVDPVIKNMNSRMFEQIPLKNEQLVKLIIKKRHKPEIMNNSVSCGITRQNSRSKLLKVSRGDQIEIELNKPQFHMHIHKMSARKLIRDNNKKSNKTQRDVLTVLTNYDNVSENSYNDTKQNSTHKIKLYMPNIEENQTPATLKAPMKSNFNPYM